MPDEKDEDVLRRVRFSVTSGHVLADIPCPHCGAPASEHDLFNYDPIWRDGDVICRRCKWRVRRYDAG